MTFPHLDGRVEALAKELDLPADTAEWLAVAALHSGCFLRSQFHYYSNQEGAVVNDGPARKAMTRFTRKLIEQNLIVEMPVDELGLLYRITSKRVYRALGADNIRHRRLASWPIMHRRLLALDYVLDHPELPWLPTEAEKMACFEALAIPRNELPSRVWHGTIGQARRYFANKHPIAVDSHAKAALFVYVDSDEQSTQGLQSWRDEHAALWSRLYDLGFGLSIVHASRNPKLSARVRRVFESWAAAPVAAANVKEVEAERKQLRAALLKDDEAALAEFGGFDTAFQRAAELGRWLKREGRSQVGYKAVYSVWLSKRLELNAYRRNPLGSRGAEGEAEGDEA